MSADAIMGFFEWVEDTIGVFGGRRLAGTKADQMHFLHAELKLHESKQMANARNLMLHRTLCQSG